MTRQATRSSRHRRAAEQREAERRQRLIWIYAGVGGVIVLAAVMALALTGSSDEPFVSTAVTVEGGPLVPLPTEGRDPAFGEAAPSLSGLDPSGVPLEIRDDGRPKVITFLAHWCPACQAEVPEVQAWLDREGLPDDVDLYSVLTLSDITRGNWPPDEWLEGEGWSLPVLVDNEDSVAASAYGLTGTPFWVAIGADGTVVGRTAGQIGPEGIQNLIDAARG